MYEHIYDNIFYDLPELEKIMILKESNVYDDRPKILKGEGGLVAPGEEWLNKHRRVLLPVTLRKISLPNRVVSQMILQDEMKVFNSNNYDFSRKIIFNVLSSEGIIEPEKNYDNLMRLSDIAIASAILIELLYSFAIAIPYYEIENFTPQVSIEKGSIGFSFNGGMFAAGLALVVACSAGIISAPIIGPIAGLSIASIGAIDLAFDWKNKVLQCKKLEQETEKLKKENRILQMDIDERVSSKSRMERLENDLNVIKSNLTNLNQYGRIDPSCKVPASNMIERKVVQSKAEEMGITEEGAHHILNNMLPNYLVLKKYTSEIKYK